MIADSSLALDVLVGRSQLDVVVTNTGSEPVRVWNRSNSWGWGILALEVAGSSPSEDRYALTVQPTAFTRNGPGFTEIQAGGRHTIVLAAGNPDWDGIERIEHLRGEALRVRAILRTPPSPEAEKYGVFVGEVNSPWRESQPPHLWLFTGA